MNVLVRCDSSNVIGTGHVMRCLNYCDNMENESINFVFLCRNFRNNISGKIVERGYKLILLEYTKELELNNYKSWLGVEEKDEIRDLIKLRNDYDEIIIDHYGIDFKIEKEIKYKKITIINELDFRHYCDVYINFMCEDIERARRLNLKGETVYRIGMENLIINKKFQGIKKILQDKKGKICIMMGGADPENYTMKVIDKIDRIIKEEKIEVFVILGKSNIYLEEIQRKIDENYRILVDLCYEDLIKVYMDCDLCIGSLSVSAYERLYINMEQICLCIAENQKIVKRKEFNICDLEELEIKFSFHLHNNIGRIV